ncbi:response regulator transcription factor [Tunturiibacter gelidiferens]|uniref:response regulator transcription factor n=1 Tax=Tunturiibacter gelidiferens TaxID=3069689 RepID=UPI003D9AE0B5
MRLRMVDYDAILLGFSKQVGEEIETCGQLRRFHPRIPILILSDSDLLDSKVNALEAGADDYVVNPFSERELTARLRSAIRRFHASAIGTNGCVAVGEIRLDPDKLIIEKSGNEILLTPLSSVRSTYSWHRPVNQSRILRYRAYFGGRNVVASGSICVC